MENFGKDLAAVIKLVIVVVAVAALGIGILIGRC